MALIGFAQTMRNDLTNIQADIHVSATFEFWVDSTITFGEYGLTPKTKIEVEADVIFSPVKHNEKLEGQPIDETADARIMVHELVYGSEDLINTEWFSKLNYHNVIVTIGTRRYRVISKAGHVDFDDVCPYHVLDLRREME